MTKVGFRTDPSEEAKGEALLRAGRVDEAEQAFVVAGALGRALALALEQADTEIDPHRRLHHLSRAVRYAPLGTDEAGAREVKLRYYRARRALLLGAAAGATQRNELAEIGRAFEALGALDEAARSYRDAGDDDARLRVLVEAGEIEGVEEVLAAARRRETTTRAAGEMLAVAEHAFATGQRDEAARALVRAATSTAFGGPPPGAAMLDKIANERARVRGTRVRVSEALDRALGSGSGPGPSGDTEEEVAWVLGDRVVLGRGEDADIRVASPLVSRRHLVLTRRPDGQIHLENVGASTLLAGATVARELTLPFGGTTRLQIGPVTVELTPLPSSSPPSGGSTGGLRVVVGGAVYRLALGPLCVGPFVVDVVALPAGVAFSTDEGDGLRLRSAHPAGQGGAVPYLEGITACPEGIDLLGGDLITTTRGGPTLLRVLPRARGR